MSSTPPPLPRVSRPPRSPICIPPSSPPFALKGPLHGGANEQVFKMLQAIGSPDRAAAYVKDQLAAGKKIMGFGHRVYRTEDPRATHLRRLSRELGEKRGEPQWHEISWQVEQAVKAERGLYANVDFYSAST